MSKIQLTIKGIAAELVLGNYLPSDKTIFNNWEEFYHYNDIIHTTQLVADYITEIEVFIDDKSHYKGKIPARQFEKEKSFLPKMTENKVYLRTECIENAVFKIETEVEDFDFNKLTLGTQDYEQLFKSATDFVTGIKYSDAPLELNWISGEPVGNICLLCAYQNGYLVPMYDAVTMKFANKIPTKIA